MIQNSLFSASDSAPETFVTDLTTTAASIVIEKTKNPNDLKNLFAKRKQNIDKVCAYKKAHPTEPFINDPTHLLVLQDRNVAWCPVFKAGSSTWLTIILDLSSVSEVS